MKKEKKKKICAFNFFKSAFIVTIGIFLTKICSMIYLIPFYAIIGNRGGALYGYAYTIYILFLSLFSFGLSFAISKIVSEYQTLGYYGAKKRVFIIAKRLSLLLGTVCFVFLMVFAPWLARSILGDLSGGNTINEITLVIRIVSIGFLFIPIIGIYRGYFAGHHLMKISSYSQVLEQFVRIFAIIFSSFISVKVFNLSVSLAIGVAILSITVGAIASYVYLIIKKRQHMFKFNEKVRSVNEPIITNKQILKKIITYAMPFILIEVFKALYSYVDMITLVKGLVKIAHLSVPDAENIMGIFSVWSTSFNIIILFLSIQIVISLIPNLTQSVVKKEIFDINQKINQMFSILLFFIFPITLSISFLSQIIWTLFYGVSRYGSNVLSYYIFVAFMIGLFTSIVSVLQELKDYKSVVVSLVVGVFFKLLLNRNLMVAFYKMGLPAYYGVITASLIGYFISFMICIIRLKFKYRINYEDMTKNLIDIICGSLFMVFVLWLVDLLLPSTINRFVLLIYVVVYIIVGGAIYFIYMWKTRAMKRVFGNAIPSKFKFLS